jgi:hypothetical protein
MLQWDEFFPEAALWNREKDFQLKYEDMNLSAWKEEHQKDNKLQKQRHGDF